MLPTMAKELEGDEPHQERCSYPGWAFLTSVKKTKQKPKKDETDTVSNIIAILYIAGTSEKWRRIFNKHNIPVHFKPGNTLRQRLGHPNVKTL